MIEPPAFFLTPASTALSVTGTPVPTLSIAAVRVPSESRVVTEVGEGAVITRISSITLRVSNCTSSFFPSWNLIESSLVAKSSPRSVTPAGG